jgi:hypothetical protein
MRRSILPSIVASAVLCLSGCSDSKAPAVEAVSAASSDDAAYREEIRVALERLDRNQRAQNLQLDELQLKIAEMSKNASEIATAKSLIEMDRSSDARNAAMSELQQKLRSGSLK